MQPLKLTTVIFISLMLLSSCSGNSTASVVGDSSVVQPANPAASGDDAGFSCKIDGKDFSESKSTGNINAAFRIKDDNKEQIFFMLADVNDPAQKLNFQIPNKTGGTTIKNYPPHYSYEGLVLKGYITYIDDPVTVNIISISSSRISGTFSGKYTLQNVTSDATAKKTIEITGGKFDIPFSTDASWKKLYHAE